MEGQGVLYKMEQPAFHKIKTSVGNEILQIGGF